MGVIDWLSSRKKALTLDDVRREEIRLGIREKQTLAKLEKAEQEREQIFQQGARVRSPLKRRQLARQYELKGRGIQMLERDLATLSKEIATVTALRLALERRQMTRDGISKILMRLSEADLQRLLEDEKISEELYLEKLGSVLETVTEGTREILEEIASEGAEVLEVWQKMDEGEIESVEDAMRVAREKIRQKERGGRTDAEVLPEPE
jgi:flagellar biosynthesis GTPase FlhF